MTSPVYRISVAGGLLRNPVVPRSTAYSHDCPLSTRLNSADLSHCRDGASRRQAAEELGLAQTHPVSAGSVSGVTTASPLDPGIMPVRSGRRTAVLGWDNHSSRLVRAHSYPACRISDARWKSLRLNFSISGYIYKSAYL